MLKPLSCFHLHMISDATGETLLSAGRAVSAQYGHMHVIEHLYPLVRNQAQLSDVIQQIETSPGIVLYTIVNKDMAAQIDHACADLKMPCVSVLEPVKTVFQAYLGPPSNHRASAQHALDSSYFKRIDALNFTMEHDDGLGAGTVNEADIVLVGISRTSKTPTSVYLANRGIKTANIPLVPDIAPPQELIEAHHPLIVGLVASADRIFHIRSHRELGSGMDASSYTDRATIIEELAYARRICHYYHWPIIDVSRRSIEETAAAIMALYAKHQNND